jgi:hypothetical protein
MFFLVLSLFLQAAAAPPDVVLRTFEEDKIGAPPPGFTTAAGRDAAPDRWTVKREGNVRMLAYDGKPSPPDSFAVAIFSPMQYHEVQLSVRLKSVGGARTAGLVWKYQDPLNHYSAQLDLVRQEIAIYRVANGNRIRLEREDDLELDPDAWHSLRVLQEDGQIRVYLGGIRVFGERDRSPHGTARVGMWVSGESVVVFDDFRVEDRVDAPQSPAKPPPPVK